MITVSLYDAVLLLECTARSDGSCRASQLIHVGSSVAGVGRRVRLQALQHEILPLPWEEAVRSGGAPARAGPLAWLLWRGPPRRGLLWPIGTSLTKVVKQLN